MVAGFGGSIASMMPREKSTMYTSAAKVRRQKKP